MMCLKKIDRYILVTALLSSLLALLLLGIIETFFTFLIELQEIGQNNYSIRKMLLYLFYDTPSRLYRIFPMAILLGSLLGLGQLSSNNEMTALRAAGLSKLRIARGALLSTLLLSVLTFSMGEWVVPYSQKKADTAQVKPGKIRQGRGFWAIADNRIIHVLGFEGNVLKQTTFYEIKNNRLTNVLTATSASLQKTNWLIPLGLSSTLTPERITPEIHTNLNVKTVIDKDALYALSTEPSALEITHLWRFIKYLDNSGLDSNEYRLAFWTKLFSPLTNLSMLVIALPLVFGHGRKQGFGANILLGIMIGLLIYLGSKMLGNVILLYNYLPIYGALIPIFLSLGLGVMFFKLKAK